MTKVKCPKCDYEWNEPQHASICKDRKVAITQSSRMKEIWEDITKKNKRGIFAKRVFDIIERFKGQEISVKHIANALDISQYTDGDLIRAILDYHVCRGQLTKIKYKKGRGGHRWIFSSVENKDCPFKDDLKHECTNKKWIKVEEGEER
jgi:hypothetical protein